jgi:hypothetical protein
MISAIGVRTHQLWMLWIGSGVIGGIGLGLGYISPVSTLVKWFKTPGSVGVWQTFVVLGLGYFVYMIAGAFGYRVPPDGWSPEGWTSPATQKAMITASHVALKHAHKAPQFWLIWAVSQRLGRHWDHRRGVADVAGDVRRRFDPRSFDRFHAVLRRPKDFGRRDRRRICRTLLVIQHRRQV